MIPYLITLLLLLATPVQATILFSDARAGLYYGSQDAAATVQFDTFSLDPQAPASTILQQGGRRGHF